MDLACKAALTATLVAMVLMVLLALASVGLRAWFTGMGAALAAAVAASVVALRLLPALPEAVAARAPAAAPPVGIAATAVVAGVLSAVICAAGSHLDPFFGGMLASLPFVCGAVVFNEHTRGRPEAVPRFLRGYVGGCSAKPCSAPPSACSWAGPVRAWRRRSPSPSVWRRPSPARIGSMATRAALLPPPP